MGTHARIEPGGHVAIDTTAWLDQRTGGPDEDLTADLLTWATNDADRDGEPGRTVNHGEWPRLAQAWCQARGHERTEPDLIVHAETRLDEDLWVLRAAVGYRYRIAVVGIGDHLPVVHAEIPNLDVGDWFDADSIDIACPHGHGWTWRTGRELVTADGDFTTLDVVFGPGPDTPFTSCTTCVPDNQNRIDLHRYRHLPRIICPTCGARCDVELPTR